VVTKTVEFTATASLESAHAALTQSDIPEALHGHNWKITAKWSAHLAAKNNFSEESVTELKRAVSELECTNLNTTSGIMQKGVTAESIAKLLFKMLENVQTDADLVSVTVEEEPDCSIEYFEYKV
jgi:6-pyruvoyl-tetrahydropterin synthase